MSGFKRATVNISQDEYQRLRDAETRLRSLPDTSFLAYQQIQQQSNEAMQKNLADMEHRQVQFGNLIAGLDEYVRNLESSTAQAMLIFEANTIAEAQTYAGSLWDHTNQILAEQSDYFQNTITAQHKLFQDELARYSRQVRKMAGSQIRKRQMAGEWLDAAGQFSVFIQQNYAHEMFTPGRMAQLDRQLGQARENLEQGFSEAAVLSAQQLYHAYSDLRVELEQRQAEWQFLNQTAWETTRQIYVQAYDSQQVQAVDLDGNFLPYLVDVNYWSQGRLAKLMEELDAIQGRLEDDHDFLDSETLRRVLNQDLPAYYQALMEIVVDARVNALNSQLRINIADLVIRSLQDQGFSLSQSDYEDADMRNAYGARLRNLEGNQVVVQVVPTGQEVGENELRLESYDQEDRTEHELQQRWYEVSRSLSYYGLAVGPYVREEQAPYNTSKPSNSPSLGNQQRRSRA